MSEPDHSQAQVYNQDITLSLLSNMNVMHSLQHTDRDVFYSTYWEDHCLPALHPMFRSTSQLLGFPAIKDAILALSACNISQISAERKSSSSLPTMGTLSPSLVHQTRSQLYYSSAIRKFTSLTQDDYRTNISLVLTILVLFGYIEASMGNFKGYYCHVQGLSGFLEDLRQTTGEPVFKSLLAAWMQSQYLIWWARTYFSSLNVQHHLPSVPLPSVLQGGFESLHERRVVVLSILCESHRLNTKATLRHWKPDMITDEAAASASAGIGADETDDMEYYKLLHEESKKLDEWVLHLPLVEQPLADDSLGAPLFFHSHDAALNFAYHIVARIMQCTEFLKHLPTRERLGSECYETEPWVRLLLRVSQGTDLRTSIIRNNYTIAFSGLLLAASLRCQDLSIGIEIESWLQALANTKPTEEGAFPVYQSLGVVKALNIQRAMGRDVFGVSQPVDDGGGTPKFSAYNSQKIDDLLVHGKSRDTGELFTECVSLAL